MRLLQYQEDDDTHSDMSLDTCVSSNEDMLSETSTLDDGYDSMPPLDSGSEDSDWYDIQRAVV